MDEQVAEPKPMQQNWIISITIAQEIYIHKLTFLHPPEHSAVQGSVDFPAISTQSQAKFQSLMRKKFDNKHIGQW